MVVVPFDFLDGVIPVDSVTLEVGRSHWIKIVGSNWFRMVQVSDDSRRIQISIVGVLKIQISIVVHAIKAKRS